MVTKATWVEPVVFAEAVRVMVPLPVPLALAAVSQAAPPSSDVQAHPVAVVTWMLTVPPLKSTI